MDPQFGAELKDVFQGPAAEASVRAVLVTGAGRGFSSGANLKAGFELAGHGAPRRPFPDPRAQTGHRYELSPSSSSGLRTLGLTSRSTSKCQPLRRAIARAITTTRNPLLSMKLTRERSSRTRAPVRRSRVSRR